jgi:adenine phosphoribosyltransferase
VARRWQPDRPPHRGARSKEYGEARRGQRRRARRLNEAELKGLIRTIPDFPRPGIQFRDITTLLLDPRGFAAAIEALAALLEEAPDLVAAIEARGFVIGAALAQRLGCGLLLIRKAGKLPGETIAEDYALEYGTDRLAMHVDACAPGARVLLVDDLIATAGTALAAMRLVRRAGATVIAAAFVVDLPDLGGSALLRAEGFPVHSLVAFEGD